MPRHKASSHPWHDLPIGENAPEEIHAVVEIPAKSEPVGRPPYDNLTYELEGVQVKYELDKDTGMCYVDRVLYSSVVYPHNYGFIPQTLCEDHDPLDVLVMMQEAVVPMCFLRVRVIGVMHMIDQGEQDDKIIAVHIDDPEFKHMKDISEVPKHRLAEIRRFFEDYKKNEHKEVKVDEMYGREEAVAAVREAMAMYRDQYIPKRNR